jgi:hypothetical protein
LPPNAQLAMPNGNNHWSQPNRGGGTWRPRHDGARAGQGHVTIQFSETPFPSLDSPVEIRSIQPHHQLRKNVAHGSTLTSTASGGGGRSLPRAVPRCRGSTRSSTTAADSCPSAPSRCHSASLPPTADVVDDDEVLLLLPDPITTIDFEFMFKILD